MNDRLSVSASSAAEAAAKLKAMAESMAHVVATARQAAVRDWPWSTYPQHIPADFEMVDYDGPTYVDGPDPDANLSDKPLALCHAFDEGTMTSEDDPTPIGDCTLPKGHPTGWHQEKRGGQVWAEWRGPHNAR